MNIRISCLAACILLTAEGASFAQPRPQLLAGPKGNVWAIAFAPDGKLVAAASDVSEKKTDGGKEITTIKGGEVHVWDTQNGDLKRTFTHPMQIGSLAFSPDGKLLAAGAFKEIKIWDAQSGELKQSLKDFEGSAKNLTFTADGKTLIAASSWFGKAEVRLWNLESGKVEKTLADSEKVEITGLGMSSDGKTLVTSCRVTEGGFSGRIRIWNLPDGTVRQTIVEPKEWVNSVALTPDGKTIAAPVGFAVKMWDAQTGKQKRQIKEFLSDVLIPSSGNTLIGAMNSQSGSDVKIIDLATGRVRQTIKVPHQGLGHLGVSADGKMLALGSGDAGKGEVRLQTIGK